MIERGISAVPIIPAMPFTPHQSLHPAHCRSTKGGFPVGDVSHLIFRQSIALFFHRQYKSDEPGLLLTEAGIMRTKRILEYTPPINDTPIRVLFTPLFAFAIPQISGLTDYTLLPLQQATVAFLYWLMVAFLIWQGNVFLLMRLDSRLSWIYTPYQKLVQLLSAYTLYTILISLFLLWLWYLLNGQEPVWRTVRIGTAMNVVAVIFISHVYQTAILIKQRTSDRIKAEKLERSKVEAELEALKNQLDPHFMFNSLNTLSHLIETDTKKALDFSDDLADVYRYLLINKGKNLVLLNDEVEFARSYFSLLQLRFGSGLQLEFDIAEQDLHRYLIPPISLQVMIENAVKHNEFDESQPMYIVIRLLQSAVVVKNTKRKKARPRSSVGTGLTNLNERYNLIVGKSIMVNDVATFFTVTLPVLEASR